MRESRPYGFVRGALSNERPYRVATISAFGPKAKWLGEPLKSAVARFAHVELFALDPRRTSRAVD